MNLFSPSEVKKWEKYTMSVLGISSLQLMEHAAECCEKWIAAHYNSSLDIIIFCGSGNNGGDGLALARLLYYRGFTVDVFIDESAKFTEETLVNLKRCKDLSEIIIKDFSNFESDSLHENTVVIDAFFGTGLNRAIIGKTADLIEILNELKCHKISLDLPSGLFCDEFSPDTSVIFKADQTLTFQILKRSMLHPETSPYCGKIHILNLGLLPEFNDINSSTYSTIDDTLILNIYKPRQEFSHKGSHGKSVVIAGSYGKIGAAVLAIKACVKTGSGLTVIVAPDCGYEILQISCPEAMFISVGENHIENLSLKSEGVVGIGPGLGQNAGTEKCFLEFIKDCKHPLVIDADALNLLAKNPNFLSFLPLNSILTPHPKEFERLFGVTKNSFERLYLARKEAVKWNVIIVLKGRHTQVITPEGKVYYNLTGNSGMAKGGSGDALLGIITSLLAQGYSSEQAAVLGVWMHGKAGDFAAEKYSTEAMTSSDLIEELSNVFKFLAEKILPLK